LSKLRIVTLGEKEYPLGDFTIGQVQRLAPLFNQADDKFIAGMETPAQAQATTTIVHIGLQSGGYQGKYEDFLNLAGVTRQQLGAAQSEIGRAIGAYKALPEPGETDAPGEANGVASTSQN
jgi:hypothetical protein